MPNITCPTCEKVLKVSSKLQGRSGKCPRCGTKINFVSPKEEAWVELPPEPDVKKVQPQRKKTNKPTGETRATRKSPSSEGPKQKPKSRPQTPARAQEPKPRPQASTRTAPSRAQEPNQPRQRKPRPATPTQSRPTRPRPQGPVPVQHAAPRKRRSLIWMLLLGLLIGSPVTAWFAFPKERTQLVSQLFPSNGLDSTAALNEFTEGQTGAYAGSAEGNVSASTDNTDGVYAKTSGEDKVGEDLEKYQPIQTSATNYAFLVGVRDYDTNAGISDLKYTENDVVELRDVLVNQGYDPEHIVTLSHGPGKLDASKNPTFENINRELDDLLGKLEEHETLIVGFSGHGVQFTGEEDNYFCPMDCNIKNRKTLVSMKGLYAKLDSCDALHKVLLVDACRDDPLAFASKSGRLELDPYVSRTPVAPQGSTTALYSCAKSQQSFETDELENGVFFHFVINGLKGSADHSFADSPADGVISIQELTSYIKTKVTEFAKGVLDREQSPEVYSKSTGEFALVNLPRESAYTRIGEVVVSSSAVSQNRKKYRYPIEGKAHAIFKRIMESGQLSGLKNYESAKTQSDLDEDLGNLVRSEFEGKAVNAQDYKTRFEYLDWLRSKMNSADSPLAAVAPQTKQNLETLLQEKQDKFFLPYWKQLYDKLKKDADGLSENTPQTVINKYVGLAGKLEKETERFLVRKPNEDAHHSLKELYEAKKRKLIQQHEDAWNSNFRLVAKKIQHEEGASSFQRLFLFDDYAATKSNIYNTSARQKLSKEYDQLLDFRRVYSPESKVFEVVENPDPVQAKHIKERLKTIAFCITEEAFKPKDTQWGKFRSRLPYYSDVAIPEFERKELDALERRLASGDLAALIAARTNDKGKLNYNRQQTYSRMAVRIAGNLDTGTSSGRDNFGRELLYFNNLPKIDSAISHYKNARARLNQQPPAGISVNERKSISEIYAQTITKLASEKTNLYKRKMKTAKLSELAALRNDSGLKGNYEAQFALATALKQKVGSSTTADLNRLYSIRAAYQQDKANMTGRLSNLGNSSAKKDSLKKLEGLYKFGVNFLDTKIGKLNGQSAGTNVVPLNGSPVLGNNRIPTTSTIPAPASNFGPSPTPVPSSIPGSAIPNWRGNLPPGQFNGGAPNGQFNGGAPNGQFNGGAPNGGFNGGAPNGGFNPVPQRNGVPQSNGGQFNSGGTAPPNNFVPNQNLRPQNGVPAGGQNPFGAQAPTNNTVPTSPGGFQNGGIFGGRIRDRVFGNGQN